MNPTRRVLAVFALSALAIVQPGCSSAFRPLEADIVNTDPALLDAIRSVMVMITVPEERGQRIRGSVSAKISTVVIIADDRALTAAHCVVGRRMDTVTPEQRAPKALIGWRTIPARVLDRGDPETIQGEWAVLELENLREGRDRTDDGVPVAEIAQPVLGERCLLIGYPARYLPTGWQQGMPDLWRRTPPDSPWRPPVPLVFEGRITGVATKTGHRVAISTKGDDLGGLSGGGVFVLREGVWKLIGPVAHDQQWLWKREIGVPILPPRVLEVVSSSPSRAPTH